jgi:hypothetical protein
MARKPAVYSYGGEARAWPSRRDSTAPVAKESRIWLLLLVDDGKAEVTDLLFGYNPPRISPFSSQRLLKGWEPGHGIP